jgi:hypothetical protein
LLALALASSGSSDGGEEVDVARSLHMDDQTLDAWSDPAYWEAACPWLSVRRDTRKEGDDAAARGAAGPAPADEARLLSSVGPLGPR